MGGQGGWRAVSEGRSQRARVGSGPQGGGGPWGAARQARAVTGERKCPVPCGRRSMLHLPSGDELTSRALSSVSGLSDAPGPARSHTGNTSSRPFLFTFPAAALGPWIADPSQDPPHPRIRATGKQARVAFVPGPVEPGRPPLWAGPQVRTEQEESSRKGGNQCWADPGDHLGKPRLERERDMLKVAWQATDSWD